ncbi:hypothetical protein L0244_39695, partial [bacterium]|nr:hypothetical protein [bacterium]
MNKKLELILAGILGVSGIVGCDDSKSNVSTIEAQYRREQAERIQASADKILHMEDIARYHMAGRRDIEDIRVLWDAKISPEEAARYPEYASGKE